MPNLVSTLLTLDNFRLLGPWALCLAPTLWVAAFLFYRLGTRRPSDQTPRDLHVANEALQREVDRLTQVAETQRLIGSVGSEPSELMVEVMERARVITGASGAAVAMLDGDALVYRAASGILATKQGCRLSVETTLSGRCLREEVSFLCKDARVDPLVEHDICATLGIRSIILVPVRAGKSVVGVLTVLSGEPEKFSESDVRALELMAGMIGAALVRAEVIEQVRLREEAEALAVSCTKTTPRWPAASCAG